ncbi:sodium-dependent bicarbonate transport family permease [Oricola indica]|uniref:sodium-dependent bicarbonate transport family permease n=1 Tax=Oricola indica TaxID=2872591 RepID=UPI003CCC16BF
MDSIFSLAIANLLTPMVLFFGLGLLAGALRSDLTLPEAVSKGISLYLMLAIGFKGGAELGSSGLTGSILTAMFAAVMLSFVMPAIAFFLLRMMTRLGSVDRAAISAHYGSISVVTFVAAAGFLTYEGVAYGGFMVALMALMETPAIVSGLALARLGHSEPGAQKTPLMTRKVAHEIFLSGSIVLLMGSFAIGWITGHDGMKIMAPVIDDPFKAVLAVFLLDMGLLVGRRIGDFASVGASLIAFGILMPIVGAFLGFLSALAIGMESGDAMLLMVLAASASYIVVPAAMRLSLPQANPAIYVTLSLAVTFPFNLVVGIPLYFSIAQTFLGN